MLTPTYPIRPLPPQTEIETVPVLRALVEANKALAELKGRAATIPNQGILIDTLALQEAKASSEIENIVTTQDELFQADLFPDGPDSVAAKEVALYRDALHLGFRQLAAQVAIRQRENSFRDKFERYVARDRHDPDLRRKAFTVITAKMGRVVHAIIKRGDDYRPFVEGPVPGGGTPLTQCREGALATL
ncbi:hypothetical protein C3920_14100 [Novacetimonas pomaceti]|nr:hypothetical protein C3920_14100 [Novacetimonas pomaceti]